IASFERNPRSDEKPGIPYGTKILAGKQGIRTDAQVVPPLGTIPPDVKISEPREYVKADVFGFEAVHVESHVDARGVRGAAVPLVRLYHEYGSAVFRCQPVIESFKSAGTGKLRQVSRKLRSGGLIQRDADIAAAEPVLDDALSIRIRT